MGSQQSRPTPDKNNALHVAIYSDEISTRVWANYRNPNGGLHEGVYKAFHTNQDANVWGAVLFALRKLQRFQVDYVFLYSNSGPLTHSLGVPLRLLDVGSGIPAEKLQIVWLTVIELSKYLQKSGGWNCVYVPETSIGKAKALTIAG